MRMGVTGSGAITTKVLAAVFALGTPFGAEAATQSSEYLRPELRAAAVERLVNAYHAAHQFDGAVLAAVGDDVVYRGAKGLANHEFGIANRPETVFRLASVTKQFTATAVLRLVEQGRVDLEAPVGRYVRALDLPAWQAVTVHRLLTHTAGVPRDVEALVDKDMGDHFEMDEMVGVLAATPLIAEPGERFSYSNAGYVLAAAVIESVTGRPYGEAVRALLFEPLGLRRTGHETRNAVIPEFAQGYITLPDRVLRSEYEDKSYVTGAGSAYSNVDDLFTWVRALRSGRVLGDSLVGELTRRQEAGYGYGWFAFPYGPAVPPGETNPEDAEFHAIAHAGGAPGFATNVRVYLDHDVTVIALSNDERARPQHLTNRIGNILLGFPDTIAPPPVSPRAYEVALADGVESALELWDDDDPASAMLPTENALNLTAYHYLEAGFVHEALTLFELQVRVFPGSANAHDSLGEGLLEAGRDDEARAAYAKALEIDPDYPNAESARDILEQIDRRRAADAQDAAAGARPFAPEVLPTGDVYRGMFSPDGDEFYYFRGTGEDNDYRIHVIRRDGDGWTAPRRVDLGGDHSDMYPTVSPDGGTMVFASYRPFPGGEGEPPQANLWRATRVDGEWRDAEPLVGVSRPDRYESHPVLEPDGRLSFRRALPDWSREEPLVASPDGAGGWTEPVTDERIDRWRGFRPDLHLWGGIVGAGGDVVLLDVSLVAADGRRGRSDIWVAKRDVDGWTDPSPVSAGINTGGWDNFPVFTPDGTEIVFVRDFDRFLVAPLERPTL